MQNPGSPEGRMDRYIALLCRLGVSIRAGHIKKVTFTPKHITGIASALLMGRSKIHEVEWANKQVKTKNEDLAKKNRELERRLAGLSKDLERFKRL